MAAYIDKSFYNDQQHLPTPGAYESQVNPGSILVAIDAHTLKNAGDVASLSSKGAAAWSQSLLAHVEAARKQFDEKLAGLGEKVTGRDTYKGSGKQLQLQLHASCIPLNSVTEWSRCAVGLSSGPIAFVQQLCS